MTLLCLYVCRAGEKITVTPSSKELLFYPPEVEATITGGQFLHTRDGTSRDEQTNSEAPAPPSRQSRVRGGSSKLLAARGFFWLAK